MFNPQRVHEAVGCCPVHLGRFMWGRVDRVFYGLLPKFLRKHLVDYFSLLHQIREFTENQMSQFCLKSSCLQWYAPVVINKREQILVFTQSGLLQHGIKNDLMHLWDFGNTLVTHIELNFIMGVSSSSWWCVGYKKLLQQANLRVIISGEFPKSLV